MKKLSAEILNRSYENIILHCMIWYEKQIKVNYEAERISHSEMKYLTKSKDNISTLLRQNERGNNPFILYLLEMSSKDIFQLYQKDIS